MLPLFYLMMGLASDGAPADFSQYDGRGGRPAAHLLIAWPHGVPVVGAMVEAIHAEGNMSVVSLVNAEMHKSTKLLLPCIYGTHEKYRPEKWRRIFKKAEYLARMSSKAIVVMIVVDHMDPTNSYNNYTERMIGVKEQLRTAYNPRSDRGESSRMVHMVESSHNGANGYPLTTPRSNQHVLHVTDEPLEIAPILRCLGMPPPESTVMARAVAASAALRSYRPRRHNGATGVGTARWSGAVERAFRTGLAALNSPGCMRAPATPAVVLTGGNRAVWPVGANQSTDVRACPQPSDRIFPHCHTCTHLHTYTPIHTSHLHTYTPTHLHTYTPTHLHATHLHTYTSYNLTISAGGRSSEQHKRRYLVSILPLDTPHAHPRPPACTAAALRRHGPAVAVAQHHGTLQSLWQLPL